jgi:phospholipase/lecithinase/hemolysin
MATVCVHNSFFAASGRRGRAILIDGCFLTHKIFARQFFYIQNLCMQKLYSLGARKFVVFAIQPNGCTPVVRAFLHVTGAACIEPVNDAVALFNSELRRLVAGGAGSRRRMPAARFTYVNSYGIIKDMLDHPGKHGTVSLRSMCCCTNLAVNAACY